MNDLPAPIPGRPRLGIALLLAIVAAGLCGHFWLIPAVEAYVPVAACDRWMGTNGLSALLLTVTASAGLGVLLFSFTASRYWARVTRSGQLPPPKALVLRTTQPVKLETIPSRAAVARYLPHVGGVLLAICVAVGISLHNGLVKPNLPDLQALCEMESEPPDPQ
ncbi:MAG: hypothetical protein AB8B96_18340 [Lysobacterales bacterium]